MWGLFSSKLFPPFEDTTITFIYLGLTFFSFLPGRMGVERWWRINFISGKEPRTWSLCTREVGSWETWPQASWLTLILKVPWVLACGVHCVVSLLATGIALLILLFQWKYSEAREGRGPGWVLWRALPGCSDVWACLIVEIQMVPDTVSCS